MLDLEKPVKIEIKTYKRLKITLILVRKFVTMQIFSEALSSFFFQVTKDKYCV